MNRRFRIPRLRYSLALLLGLMIPLAALAAWYGLTLKWHQFRARELAKLPDTEERKYEDTLYRAFPFENPAARSLPEYWLGSDYVAPIESVRSHMKVTSPRLWISEEIANLKNPTNDEGFNFHAFPELRVLDIYTAAPHFNVASFEALTALEELVYKDVYSNIQHRADPMLPEYLAALPQLPRLKKLLAVNRFRFTDSRWLPVLIDKAPALKELSLSLFKLQPATISAVEQPLSWEIAEFKLWEAQPELYWDFVQALLRQPHLQQLQIENYPNYPYHSPEYLAHHEPDRKSEIDADYAAYQQFKQAMNKTSRRLEVRHSALQNLNLQHVPSLVVEDNPFLKTLRHNSNDNQSVEIRNCPRLLQVVCYAARIMIDNCPLLEAIHCDTTETIELRGPNKLTKLYLGSFEKISLSPGCPGFKEIVLHHFDSTTPTPKFDMPAIPALEQVRLRCLNEGILTSLARQQQSLEIEFALPNKPKNQDCCTLENFTRLLNDLKIHRLYLRQLRNAPARAEYAALLSQAANLQELQIERLGDLLVEPVVAVGPLMPSLRLPPKLKKLTVMHFDSMLPDQRTRIFQLLQQQCPELEISYKNNPAQYGDSPF